MKKKYIKSIFVILIFSLQAWFFFITFHYPLVGIYVESNQQHEWVIRDVDKNSLNPLLDIQIGDIVKQVDNEKPELFWAIQRWRTIEQAHQLVLSRDGYDREIFLADNDVMKYGIFSLFSGLLTMILSALLYIKMNNSPSARLLSLVFLSIGLIWISLGASARGDAVGKILITSLMSALPFIFYHFLVVFFKEKGNIILPTKVLKYLYLISILGFSIRLLSFIPSLSYSIYRYNEVVTLSIFIVGFLLNICILSFLYFKYGKEKSSLSSIIKSVWFSLFVSFSPVILLSFIPRLMTGNFFMDDEYTSLFILFLPISFAYLIASNQLYDIGLVVRRFVYAGMIAVVPCGIFAAANAVAFPNDTDLKHLMFTFLLPVILLSVVLYSMEYMTTKFEGFLFPRKFILNSALKKISKSLGAISSFRDLKDIVLVDIVNTLEVMGGAIVIKFQDEMETILEGDMNKKEVEQLVASGAFEEHAFYTCIEINHHEEYTAYLIMTRKKTNTLLGKEELQWLNLIISYLAVSMENVHLIRKMTSKLQQLASQLPDEQAAQDIQWFRKLMFELQEEERIRIATDLHDTTMQDLFFLKRRFVDLLEKYIMNQEDKDHLNNIINFIELINTGLRQSCFELHPHLLQEVGLILTVQRLLEKESYHCPFTIEFTGDKAFAIENRDLVTKKHIFRIVQELLNNAKKHSQATEVQFRMTVETGFFCLSYEDDGVGFAESSTPPSKPFKLTGIGMEQVKSRVLFLGGDIELHSKLTGGVHFRITIPMKEVQAL